MVFRIAGTTVIDDSRNITVKSSDVSSVLLGLSPAQGFTAGYASGGGTSPGPPFTSYNVIDKFPFATNTNASDVGDLTLTKNGGQGNSSSVSGYNSGGFPAIPARIDKFPFATNSNASNVGSLSVGRETGAGQSSTVSGYASGGLNPNSSPIILNIIDKFPFAADGTATDVGDLTQDRWGIAGQSSTSVGYSSGGFFPPNYLVTVDRFPFSTDANATNVGNLTVGRYFAAGQSSDSSGYSSGGFTLPFNTTNAIDRFPFSTNANATDVGDLTVARSAASGQSSNTHGYTSGGHTGGAGTSTNVIDRFPFAANVNATDVGDVTVSRTRSAGHEV